MRFRYLKDPLFLCCVVLYFANRWVVKPYLPNEFSRSYLNDVICLPFWVPIMLFLMRRIGLRKDEGPPTAAELLIPLLIWSWTFEIYLPSVPCFKGLATSDYLDIFAYALGGCFAAGFWKFWYGERRSAKRLKGRVVWPALGTEGAPYEQPPGTARLRFADPAELPNGVPAPSKASQS
jgi:hypothetical protein